MSAHRQGRLAEAEAGYRALLQRSPRHAGALHLLAVALTQQGRPDQAMPWFDQALALIPGTAAVHSNRGLALQALGRIDEAIACFDTAIRLDPAMVEPHFNKGNSLAAKGLAGNAIECHDRALALDGNCHDALCGRARALQLLGRHEEALTSYERALRLRSGDLATLLGLANVLQVLHRPGAAMIAFGKVLELQPDADFVFGSWLHAKMSACDWAGLDAAFAQLADGIRQGRRISMPFPVIATPMSRRLQRRCTEIHVRSLAPTTALPSIAPPSRGDRIRLAYFSADFRNHPVAYLTAGLFEQHDRARFELHAFSFGPPCDDEMRQRLRRSFDHFIEVGHLSDLEVATLARRRQIDIAVDLMGLTANNRAGVFALRAAPVQVNWLGYPGTMGADFIDYLITDAHVTPAEHADAYSEKLVFMPHSFQPNDDRREAPPRIPTREEVGLPAQGFVFCSFNSSYKITPREFDIWMRLLGRVPGSVLWLADSNAAAYDNLRREAVARGIDADRLVFKPPAVRLIDHLANLPLADLFLDSFYYNAHTTASDALWFGVPVLTRQGDSFASRVAAGLLHAIGLAELITVTDEDYEARALAFALDPAKHLRLKQKLAANRRTHPLFDTARFAKDIERAYGAMWQRLVAGQPPDHIVIAPQ